MSDRESGDELQQQQAQGKDQFVFNTSVRTLRIACACDF